MPRRSSWQDSIPISDLLRSVWSYVLTLIRKANEPAWEKIREHSFWSAVLLIAAVFSFVLFRNKSDNPLQLASYAAFGVVAIWILCLIRAPFAIYREQKERIRNILADRDAIIVTQLTPPEKVVADIDALRKATGLRPIGRISALNLLELIVLESPSGMTWADLMAKTRFRTGDNTSLDVIGDLLMKRDTVIHQLLCTLIESGALCIYKDESTHEFANDDPEYKKKAPDIRALKCREHRRADMYLPSPYGLQLWRWSLIKTPALSVPHILAGPSL